MMHGLIMVNYGSQRIKHAISNRFKNVRYVGDLGHRDVMNDGFGRVFWSLISAVILFVHKPGDQPVYFLRMWECLLIYATFGLSGVIEIAQEYPLLLMKRRKYNLGYASLLVAYLTEMVTFTLKMKQVPLVDIYLHSYLILVILLSMGGIFIEISQQIINLRIYCICGIITVLHGTWLISIAFVKNSYESKPFIYSGIKPHII